MAYDAARQQVVLFGGRSKAGLTAETWLWNGKTWTQAKPPASPSARYFHSMAYDSARQQVVLFGGTTSRARSAETWTWDGKTWTPKLSLKLFPSARFRHSLAYDSVRQQVVLFGGATSTGSSAETWTWDGKNWAPRLFLKVFPSARNSHALAYDSARQQVVLFGGEATTGTSAETWTWDGKTWTQVKPPSSPAGRYYHSMAYDSAKQQVVLFGGNTRTSPYQSAETWTWDLPISKVSGTFTPYGLACGPVPHPSLSSSGTGLPNLGKNFILKIGNAPSNSTFGLLSAGISKTKLGAFSLPISLTSFGLKGCNLYQSHDVTWTFRISAGTGQAVLPIPYQKALHGARAHFQAFLSAPKSNSASIISTNAGTAVVGNL